MNLKELLEAINKKKAEVEALANADKLDEAAAAKKELEKMQAKFDILKSVADKEITNQVTVSTQKPVEPVKDAVHEFAEAARHGFKNSMNEGTGADGGYTVPADIQTKINKYKEAEYDITAFTDNENVTTNSGRRTYQKRSQLTGFIKVDEGGKIKEIAGPQFEVLNYTIGKYAGYLPVTNELLADSDANITATISKWLAKQDVATRNAGVFAILDKIEKTDLKDLDGIKKTINVTLGAKFAGSVRIYTNDDGLNYLDTLKDGNKRYLLSPDPANPMQLILTVGARRIPVEVIPNEVLKSDTTTTAGSTIIPFYIGDMFESVKVFDRQKLSILASNIAAAGNFNAYEQDMTLFRGIDRLDFEAKDTEAMVHGTITVAA